MNEGIEDGYFVVDEHGKVGLTIGMITPENNLVGVQYGNSGPYARRNKDWLRFATEQEVRDARLYGVGGKIK